MNPRPGNHRVGNVPDAGSSRSGSKAPQQVSDYWQAKAEKDFVGNHPISRALTRPGNRPKKQEREAKKSRPRSQLRKPAASAISSLIRSSMARPSIARMPKCPGISSIWAEFVACCAPRNSETSSTPVSSGVVSLRGSYLLVSLETLAAFRDVAPDLVPDLKATEPEDDGSHYPPVPDDLIW